MSQVATYRDRGPVVAKPYASGGCPISVDNEKCGETQGLDIIMDFHKTYQEKMNEIDISAGGDNLQEKVDLQEQWINDLTEQNKLLARVIQELESETIGKINQLEDKLNNAVRSFGEEDNAPLEEKEKVKEPNEQQKVPSEIEEDLMKQSEENTRLKQELEDVRKSLSKEVVLKQNNISLLQSEIYQMQEKNIEAMRESSLKDDIIKELRKELKKTKHKMIIFKKESENNKKQTSEKSVWVREPEVQRVSHSNVPQESSNSAIIIIHRHDDGVQTIKSKFESSDSSGCDTNEIPFEGPVQNCRSENDIKPINWMKPTRERSILTKVGKRIQSDQRYNQLEERNSKRLNIPRHIPVKTYVNNIEYHKEMG